MLSTGKAADVTTPVAGAYDADNGTALNTGNGVSGHDMTQLSIELDPPAGATCVSFDFAFLSEEYPEWVGSDYNDAFVAELDTSTWSTSGNVVNAPGNFAFDGANNPITVNAVGLGGFNAANAAGTASALTRLAR